MVFQTKNDLFSCILPLINFIKIVVFICKRALAKLKRFFWRRISLYSTNNDSFVIIIFMAYAILVAFCLFLSFVSNNLKQCYFSIKKSALLTWFQTDVTSSLWIFVSLSHRSSFSRNVSMQWQGARKNGGFHRLHRAKLQPNTWGMHGERLEVLELTDIFTPLLNKPATLWYGKPSFLGQEVTSIKLRTLLSFLSRPVFCDRLY